MISFFRLLLGAALLGGVLRANEAVLHVACVSVSVAPSTATDAIGSTLEIALTSDFDDNGIRSFNGEVYVVDGTSTYGAAFSLENVDFEFTYEGFLEVNLPNAVDLNRNFLLDFFEVDLPVQATTAGRIGIGAQERPVTVTWSRAAGETFGTLQVTFAFESQFIAEVTFTHTFEIFHYTGVLQYTPGAQDAPIDATVDLQRQGAEGRWTGTFPLTVLGPDTLSRGTAHWTNLIGESFEIIDSFGLEGIEFLVNRRADGDEYLGSFYFVDGIPSTPFPDEFDLWDFWIRDPQDSNENGIPDLSDPTGPIPSTPPELRLNRAVGHLELEVKSAVGTTVTLERRTSMTVGPWSPVQTFTLSYETEVLVVPNPEDATQYWRVRIGP